MDNGNDQMSQARLESYLREAREILDLLNRGEDLQDLRHRCRRLRFAICTAYRSSNQQVLRRILGFPYPHSNCAPPHQLFGWLSHLSSCIEDQLGSKE